MIIEPRPGDAVPETKPADWQGAEAEDTKLHSKELGLNNDPRPTMDIEGNETIVEKDHMD